MEHVEGRDEGGADVGWRGCRGALGVLRGLFPKRVDWPGFSLLVLVGIARKGGRGKLFHGEEHSSPYVGVCDACEILCVLREVFILDGKMWPGFSLSVLVGIARARGPTKSVALVAFVLRRM